MFGLALSSAEKPPSFYALRHPLVGNPELRAELTLFIAKAIACNAGPPVDNDDGNIRRKFERTYTRQPNARRRVMGDEVPAAAEFTVRIAHVRFDGARSVPAARSGALGHRRFVARPG